MAETKTTFAQGQLRSIVERIERLEEEKKTIAGDIKEVYAEAKANGFDIKALRAVRVDTLRGPIKFDQYGNVVGNVYIRKVEKKDGRLVNTNIQTYPDVSQFWTYDPKEFLKHPVWSRDYPPMKG